MIAVDTSALVAIVLHEPERDEFRRILRNASKCLISSVSVIEARIVIHKITGQRGIMLLEDTLGLSTFEIVSPDTAEIEMAYRAFVTYGKGNGHPAQLNFGDLFSYALAKVRGVPLLFKGNDFGKTDIRVAGGNHL